MLLFAEKKSMVFKEAMLSQKLEALTGKVLLFSLQMVKR
jgi:hypothetical protein